MHYHIWKANAAGEKRSFKVEGEFYQQVEIDINTEAYEKLNVPMVMNMLPAKILHDFQQVCNLYDLIWASTIANQQITVEPQVPVRSLKLHC